jgi:hypothetical protein
VSIIATRNGHPVRYETNRLSQDVYWHHQKYYDDAMKTPIFTTKSNSYQTTIQILQQQIAAPTAQQCMDAIREYAEPTTTTNEIRDASMGAAISSRGGNGGRPGGCGGRGSGCECARRNGRQKHTCTYCKPDNHTTKACAKRKHTDIDRNTGGKNTGGTNTGSINNPTHDKCTCAHSGLSGHYKSDMIHFKRALDQCIKVHKCTASALFATAGDRNLI